jgi:hypothetical protein
MEFEILSCESLHLLNVTNDILRLESADGNCGSSVEQLDFVVASKVQTVGLGINRVVIALR